MKLFSLHEKMVIPLALLSMSFTTCERPTDVYIFQVPNCAPEQPIVDFKKTSCRLKMQEANTVACDTNFAKYEADVQNIKISFMMNSDANDKCQIYAAINYPQSGISDKTKDVYYEVMSRAIRSCLEDKSLVLKDERRVDDEGSYAALCDKRVSEIELIKRH